MPNELAKRRIEKDIEHYFNQCGIVLPDIQRELITAMMFKWYEQGACDAILEFNRKMKEKK